MKVSNNYRKETNMAYTKQTWSCGDTITADKLNHMESGIEEAIECCSGGGTADVGYSCEEGYVTVFDGSVTTEENSGMNGAEVVADSQISETIKVTFNGTAYECERRTESLNGETAYVYGADIDFSNQTIDFSEYPFAIMNYGTSDIVIITETAGTYTVKVETVSDVVLVTECFRQAVAAAGGSGFVVTMTTDGDKQIVYSLDKTYREIETAINSGQLVRVVGNGLPSFGTFTVLVNYIGTDSTDYYVSLGNNMAWSSSDPDVPLTLMGMA